MKKIKVVRRTIEKTKYKDDVETNKYEINLHDSIMVGDEVSDIEAGRNAGIKLFLFKEDISIKNIISISHLNKIEEYL